MNLALKRSARMAWNAVMRFGCCLCICGILLGSAAVPRAKAVVTEAVTVGFSPAILALYMKSAGLSLTATSTAAGAAAMAEMVGGYAAATGTTASAVSSSIAAGAVISTSGAIILGVAAVSLLAALTAWAISEYKLDPGAVPTQIYSGVTEAQMADGSFVSVYDGDTPPETMPVDAFIDNGKYYLYDGSYVQLYGQYQYFYDSTGSQLKSANRSVGGVALGVYTSSFGPYPCLLWYDVDGQFLDKTTLMYGTTPISALYGPDAVASLSVSLPSDFEAAPEVLETQQMVIDVGAGEGATEETIYNTVFDGIADGTLTSTYEITDVDTGTDTEPDVDPDTGGDTGSGTEDFPDPESLGLADLGDALTTRFPFSIPWDLYRAVKLLVAPAEAPYFEIDFLQPIAYRLPEGWQGSTTIVFDMAEYELIGQVSRWTSTVGFCLALIAGSKRYIWMS